MQRANECGVDGSGRVWWDALAHGAQQPPRDATNRAWAADLLSSELCQLSDRASTHRETHGERRHGDEVQLVCKVVTHTCSSAQCTRRSGVSAGPNTVQQAWRGLQHSSSKVELLSMGAIDASWPKRR